MFHVGDLVRCVIDAATSTPRVALDSASALKGDTTVKSQVMGCIAVPSGADSGWTSGSGGLSLVRGTRTKTSSWQSRPEFTGAVARNDVL